jgi:hypothetical protein
MSISNVDDFERQFDDEVQKLNYHLELAYTTEIELLSIWNAALNVIKFLPYLLFLIGLF